MADAVVRTKEQYVYFIRWYNGWRKFHSDFNTLLPVSSGGDTTGVNPSVSVEEVSNPYKAQNFLNQNNSAGVISFIRFRCNCSLGSLTFEIYAICCSVIQVVDYTSSVSGTYVILLRLPSAISTLPSPRSVGPPVTSVAGKTHVQTCSYCNY
jgi:hypothetical protein